MNIFEYHLKEIHNLILTKKDILKLDKIENFDDLSQFRVENSIIKSKKNEIAKNTYDQWKLIIDKNFIKNQA